MMKDQTFVTLSYPKLLINRQTDVLNKEIKTVLKKYSVHLKKRLVNKVG